MVGSIYGEEAERQYCKSGEKKLCSEGGWGSYGERCIREAREEQQWRREREMDERECVKRGDRGQEGKVEWA